MLILNEPINVEMKMDNDQVSPAEFKWRGQSHHIVKSTLPSVNRTHSSASACYFVRNKEQKLFKITYDLKNFNWFLNYIFD